MSDLLGEVLHPGDAIAQLKHWRADLRGATFRILDGMLHVFGRRLHLKDAMSYLFDPTLDKKGAMMHV